MSDMPNKAGLDDLLMQVSFRTQLPKAEATSILLQGVTEMRAEELRAHIKDTAYDMVWYGLNPITEEELQKWFDQTPRDERDEQVDLWIETYSPLPLLRSRTQLPGYHQTQYSFGVTVAGQVFFTDLKDMGGDGVLWVLYSQGVWGATLPNESRACYLTMTAYFPSDDDRGQVAALYETWLRQEKLLKGDLS